MLNKFPKDFEGSIKLNRLCSQSSIYPHSHEFLELVYIEKGSAMHNIGGVSYELNAGNYFVIDFETNHEYFSKNSDLTIINCLFLPEFLDITFADVKNFNELVDRYFFRITGRKIKGPTSNQIFYDEGEIGTLIKKMLDEYENRSEAFVQVLRCALSEIIIKTVRKIGSDSKLTEATKQILQRINKDYMQDISLSLICEDMNYSLPYISLKIKKETGMTFREHLQNKRIEKACQMLIETTLPITQIAERVGYNDIKFFNFIFKKVTKTTPRDYRKQNQ